MKTFSVFAKLKLAGYRVLFTMIIHRLREPPMEKKSCDRIILYQNKRSTGTDVTVMQTSDMPEPTQLLGMYLGISASVFLLPTYLLQRQRNYRQGFKEQIPNMSSKRETRIESNIPLPTGLPSFGALASKARLRSQLDTKNQ